MPRQTKRIQGIWLAALFFMASGRILRGATNDDLNLFSKDLGLSVWDETYKVRTGVGYKDNVLLDETGARAGPFILNGLEITIFKLPLGGWEYFFFVTGEDDRYWRDVGVGSEDLWLGAAKAKRDFGNGWQFDGLASYAYEAQVLDLLSGEGVTQQAPTKVIGHTIILRPSVRRNLGKSFWLELELSGTRQFFTFPGFSYWQTGPKLILGRDYGHHSDLTLSYALQDTLYDSETQVAADGTALDGTQLTYFTQKVELTSRHYWDTKQTFESTTQAGFDYNTDNGSGYFNYYRYGISEQLDYAAHGWKVTASTALQYYGYPNQHVLTNPDVNLYQTGLTLNLKVERTLTTWAKLFMEYEYEHAFSDDSSEHYIVNTIKGGTSWEF